MREFQGAQGRARREARRTRESYWASRFWSFWLFLGSLALPHGIYCSGDEGTLVSNEHTEHSLLMQQQVQAGITGDPKGKHRDHWSWSKTREPRALAELDMS